MSITPRSVVGSASQLLENSGRADKPDDTDSLNKAHPYRLPKALRLDQEAVAAVIKFGKRIRVGFPTKNGQPRHGKTTFSLKLHQAHAMQGVQFKTKRQPRPDFTNTDTTTKPLCIRQSPSRIAIAVPKRLLKSAVLRNKIKRWIRESFRQHAVRSIGVDMLITLEQKLDPKKQPNEARAELHQLFSDTMLNVEIKNAIWKRPAAEPAKPANQPRNDANKALSSGVSDAG